MLDKLLATAATNAKLAIAAAAGAALVAGGSAVAIQQVSDDTAGTPSVTSSLSGDNDNEGAEHRSDTATARIGLPKPTKSPDAAGDGAQGVHGACVSAVAQDKTKVGREHGKAVSEAAHTCPKGDDAAGSTQAGSDDADDADAEDGDTATKPAKPAQGAHGHSAEHKPSHG